MPRIRIGDTLLSLVCLAALWLPSSHAAAPPVSDEVQGPDLIEVDPIERQLELRKAKFAAAILAVGQNPTTGSFAAAAVVVAGKHEKIRAWQLADVLSGRYERTFLGAATLAGITPASPYSALGTLVVGHWLHCWPLEDTDRCSKLPQWVMDSIRDSFALDGEGTPEAGAYSFVLVRANYTSAKAFASVVRRDITLTHLLESPNKYRGEVVRVTGKLQRINRFDTTFEASTAGVSDLYDAWIADGPHVFRVVFSAWPEGLSKDLLGTPKIEQQPTVTFDGYFFKLLKGRDFKLNGRKKTSDVPLIVGHTPIVLPPSAAPADTTAAWVKDLIFIFLGVFLAALVGVLGLTLWLRRTDNKVRRRLFAARSPEFILPPPDDRPAVPIAPPVQKAEPVHASPPRFQIPPNLGHSPEGGAPGRGGDRGSTEDPPEDAGL